MDRLQKKCVVASTGVHLLLASVLLVGPAFVSSRDNKNPLPPDMPVLEFVPIKTTDKMISGGGNPNANSAPLADPLPPAPPKPAPKAIEKPAPEPEPPKKVQEPDPPKDTVKPVNNDPDPESVTPAPKPTRKKIEVNLKPTVRKSDSKTDAKAIAKAKADAQAKEEARARAETQQRLAKLIGHSADVVGNGLSTGTSVELKGPGGGGVPYANFRQAVMSAYDHAWTPPDGVTDSRAVAVATVTIARDGSVVSARITRSSGNAAVDRSVRAALERVTYIAPLPDEAKENQRTLDVNFDVNAKRGIG